MYKVYWVWLSEKKNEVNLDHYKEREFLVLMNKWENSESKIQRSVKWVNSVATPVGILDIVSLECIIFLIQGH